MPSIVTAYNPGWPRQLETLQSLSISEVALFLIGLGPTERRKLYSLMDKIKNLSIPFVHARSDMSKDEYYYLMDKFHTQRFNLHAARFFKRAEDLGELQKVIYIESSKGLVEADVVGYGGLYLDISHIESSRLTDGRLSQTVSSLIGKYPVGANHFSAISQQLRPEVDGEYGGFDNHLMTDLSEFNYLTSYPEHFFGEYIAIELINPIEGQLKLIEYLKTMAPFNYNVFHEKDPLRGPSRELIDLSVYK